MTRWVAFAALTLLVVALVLFSARASERLVEELTAEPTPHGGRSDGVDDLDATPPSDDIDRFDATGPSHGPDDLDATGSPDDRDPTEFPDDRDTPKSGLSSTALLANVGASHALFALVLAAGIWLADVPVSALGVGALTGGPAVAVGVVVGLAIAAANTLLGAAIDADPSADLRELLAPESTLSWVALLAVVLPIIAGFEELLFRAILVGAFSTGFDLSPWLLAVGSSALFAAGHGAQGRTGIAATGVLGFVLAAVFVLTWSLLVVFVAHYVVNAVEFVVVEGFGYDPFER